MTEDWWDKLSIDEISVLNGLEDVDIDKVESRPAKKVFN